MHVLNLNNEYHRSISQFAMPQFQQRRKSKPRWSIPGRILLPRKFCSVFSHAFASKPSRQQGFCSSECMEVRMMKAASVNRELASSDHDDSSSFSGARRRAFKIARIRCKWSKKSRDTERDENAERSKQLGSRFSAVLGLGKKDSGFGVRKWKISPVNKVGSNEDSFSGQRKRAGVDEEEVELCKKRILMGERCRALNSSGSLHYDHNGVLLPEFLPYE